MEPRKISLWHPASLISTVFCVGKIPFAPGTWGSVAGIVVLFIISFFGLITKTTVADFQTALIILVVAFVVFYFIGYYAINIYQKKTNTEDASEIVYDETFAQLLTYYLANFLIVVFHVKGQIENSFLTNICGIFLPFIFFRLFDITKPWPISIIDRKMKGAHGVMLDDVLAAVFAAIASTVVFALISNYNIPIR